MLHHEYLIGLVRLAGHTSLRELVTTGSEAIKKNINEYNLYK